MILQDDFTDIFLDDEYQFNEFAQAKDAKEQAMQDMFEDNLVFMTEEELIELEYTIQVGITFATPTDYFKDENDEL